MSAGTEQATRRKPEAESQAEVAIALTIFVAAYNTRELFSDCLESIYQNPPCEPYEIIVVDDASKDGVVSCRLLNGDGTIQWSVKSLPNAGLRAGIVHAISNGLQSKDAPR